MGWGVWAWVGWVGWCGRALACHAWPRVAPTQPYSDKVQSLEQQRVAQEQKLSEVIGCSGGSWRRSSSEGFGSSKMCRISSYDCCDSFTSRSSNSSRTGSTQRCGS